MKNKKEIVSLNVAKFEAVDGMSLDERLENLTSKELEVAKAGDACQWMDYEQCQTMCNGVNIHYCPTKGACPTDGQICMTREVCGGLCYFDCGGYDEILGCVYYDLDCFSMT